MNTENKFEWTDELVKEFHQYTKTHFGGLLSFIGYSDGILEHFKKSKQQNTIQKDWEIETWSWTSGGGNKNPAKIKSVKRLSDEEVFSVGDSIVCNNLENKILEFELIHEGYTNEKSLRIKVNPINHEKLRYFLINDISKVKQPLFKTEDGVNIFEGDAYFSVCDNFQLLYTSFATKDSIGTRAFSTKQAAEDYILMNKPVLSVNDVLNISSKKNYIEITQSENYLDRGATYSDVWATVVDNSKLKELAKSKIESK